MAKCTIAQMRNSRKLFNFRPFVFVGVFLAFGVAFSVCRRTYSLSLLFVLIPLVLGAVILFFSAPEKPLVCALAILASFAFGFGNTEYRLSDLSSNGYYYENECTVTGYVEGVYYSADGQATLFLTDVSLNGEAKAGRLRLTVSRTDAKVGDEVAFEGTVSTVFQNHAELTEGADVITFVAHLGEGCIVVTGHENGVFVFVRERIKTALERGMTKTPAAVCFALITGDSSGIDAELINGVRRGGIAHIFAVSGLHIGALFAVLVFVLKKTKLSRLLCFTVVAAVLTFYGGVCRFTPSVIRAIVMCLVGYADALTGVKKDILESLGKAGILLLSINPFYLFEAGFILSFSASAGIAILSGTLVRESSKNKYFQTVREENLPLFALILKKSRAYLCVTLSATLFSAPVLIGYFGSVSVWTLLTNFIFVPLIGVAFTVTFFVAIVCAVFPFLSVVVLYLPSVFWSVVLFLLRLAEFSGEITLAFNAGAFVFYYLALCFVSEKVRLQKTEKLLIAFAFLCICFLFAL